MNMTFKHSIWFLAIWAIMSGLFFLVFNGAPGVKEGGAILVSGYLGLMSSITVFLVVKMNYKAQGCCPDDEEVVPYRRRVPKVHGDRAYNELMKGEPVNSIEEEWIRDENETIKRANRRREEEDRAKRRREEEQRSNIDAMNTAVIVSTVSQPSSDSSYSHSSSSDFGGGSSGGGSSSFGGGE